MSAPTPNSAPAGAADRSAEHGALLNKHAELLREVNMLGAQLMLVQIETCSDKKRFDESIVWRRRAGNEKNSAEEAYHAKSAAEEDALREEIAAARVALWDAQRREAELQAAVDAQRAEA